MPIPQYRAPKDSQPWGLLGAIGNFLSPPGYVPQGPLAQSARKAASAQTAGGFNLGRSAAATEIGGSGVRPEGSMATLGGKPVQWMDNRWVPFLTEGEMARQEQTRVRPEGSMATLGGKPVQWMDNRWVPFLTEGEMARQEQARIQAQVPAAPVLPPPSSETSTIYGPRFLAGTTPIVRGTRDGVTPDRTQSDEYKAQLSQYGALQKAKKFEEADKLGMEIWQQKYGKTPLGQPGGVVGTYNPLMEGMPGRVQTTANVVPGQNMPTPGFSTESSFSIGANAVPAPWSTQGAAVSEPYSEAMSKAAEKTNPMNLISQQPLEIDVLNRVSDFLSQIRK